MCLKKNSTIIRYNDELVFNTYDIVKPYANYEMYV